MEQLSGLDAMFIHAEQTGMPMHISSFSVYDPATVDRQSIDFDEIEAIFEKMVGDVSVMRAKLVKAPFNIDQPYWVPVDDFDIQSHLHRFALPEPADWAELRKLIGHLHAQPLNRNLPLWEAYIIEGLDKALNTSAGSFGIFLKVHHSIMDGATGMAIFSSLHTITPHAEQALSVNDGQSTAADYTKPSAVKMLTSACLNNTQRYFKFARLLAEAVPVYRRMRKGMDEERIKLLEIKPRTRFNGPISAHRSVDRFVADFEDIRAIKRMVPGATVNDVALCIVGGALRKYLQARKELPEGTLVASVPINVRDENDANNHGNVLSVMNVALHTEIEDPLTRLQAVHEASQEGKEFAEAMGHGLLNRLCDTIYSGLASWALAKINSGGLLSRLPPANHTVVSNVPGLPIPFYFAGCKMVDSFGLGPLIPGTALFHTVSSSYQHMSISVTVCSEILPDVDFYIACLATSFHELKALVKAAGDESPGAEKSPAKKARKKKPQPRKLVSVSAKEAAVSTEKSKVASVASTEMPAPTTRQ